MKTGILKISLTIFILTIIANNCYSQDDFSFGVFATNSSDTITYYTNFHQIEALGVNKIEHRVLQENKDSLESRFDGIIATNWRLGEWINYYSNAYYKRWEAEETVPDTLPGFKHKYGTIITENDTTAWAVNQSSPRDSLLFGPHYYQGKKYRSFFDDTINYYVSFNIKLTGEPLIQNPGNLPVCKLSIVYRYRELENKYPVDTVDLPLDSLIVYANDLSTEHFKKITFNYSYPDTFILDDEDTLFYDDGEVGGVGIQFKVDWLGNWKIAVDYVEVYDENIGKDFASNTGYQLAETRILNYASSYSDWAKIEYWRGNDEPQSIDNYEPIRIVNEILKNDNYPPLIVVFYPRWNGRLNGAYTFDQFVELADPEFIFMDNYPFSFDPQTTEDRLERMLERFQEAHNAMPGFFYIPQAYERVSNNRRMPTFQEFRMSVMLALAYGAKGIYPWKYYSTDSIDALVGLPGTNFEPSPLYHSIKNYLSGRLTGTLGSKLMELDYTGNFLSAGPDIGSGLWVSDDYLSIYSTSFVLFHAGLLEDKNNSFNKHFLLVNRLTDSTSGNRNCSIKINDDDVLTTYYNWRFRNVEGGIDTTFNTDNYLSYTDYIEAGEGHLFQVAPVLLEGGVLRYNETLSNSTNLNEDLIIDENVTLTLNQTLNAYGNIYLKDGAEIITTYNQQGPYSPRINFYNGKKLIVEGDVEVTGTDDHNIYLNFISAEDSNGIDIKSDFLTMKHCNISNADIGVKADSGSYFYIDSTYFSNCNTAVFINNYSGSPFIPSPDIKNSSFTNCSGITVTNASSLVIKDNTLSNMIYGISGENVSDIQILGNNISSTSDSSFGIFMSSSDGDIRNNTITGFGNGIILGNSSPVLGNNEIYENSLHGLLIVSNSQPDLRLEIAGNPPLSYPISGYNEIYENGGLSSDTSESNDGSEIFLDSSSVLLNTISDDGCNFIYDDRTTPDTASHYLLINGDINVARIDATHQVWGSTTLTNGRFGDLSGSILWDPYNIDCYIPQGRGESLMIMGSGGVTIDTVYSTGSPSGELSTIESQYASADYSYYTGDYETALSGYNQIVTQFPDTIASAEAYSKLLSLNKLLGSDETEFSSLKSLYDDKASATNDLALKKILKQLSRLSLVASKDYNNAINGFLQVAQNNPNSSEAFFANVDILTTSLLMEDGNGLGKKVSTKYVAKNSSDYLTKLKRMLRDRFGSKTESSKEKIIPEVYYLYQNYPNPFNPSTTIKFNIPQVSKVELKIYDILGREVTTIINNEVYQPGVYEKLFDASYFASGVYIYRITAKDFVSAKKMLLLK